MVARHLRRKPATARLLAMVQHSEPLLPPDEEIQIPAHQQTDFTTYTTVMSQYITDNALQGPDACYHASSRNVLQTMLKRPLSSTAFNPSLFSNRPTMDSLMEAALHTLPDNGISVSVFTQAPRKGIATTKEVLIFRIENPGPLPNRR